MTTIVLANFQFATFRYHLIERRQNRVAFDHRTGLIFLQKQELNLEFYMWYYHRVKLHKPFLFQQVLTILRHDHLNNKIIAYCAVFGEMLKKAPIKFLRNLTNI